MHRAHILALLDAHLARWPDDRARVTKLRRFVEAYPNCFERGCVPGHVTGSAWILSPDHRSVLLTHHKKLGRWLQLGGHADGDPDPWQVALREAREESGLATFTTLPAGGVTLDVDVHPIPARGGEPAHLHYDVRYLLVAAAGERIRQSDESHALRWVERARLAALVDEPSILRMERRTRVLLSSRSRSPE